MQLPRSLQAITAMLRGGPNKTKTKLPRNFPIPRVITFVLVSVLFKGPRCRVAVAIVAYKVAKRGKENSPRGSQAMLPACVGPAEEVQVDSVVLLPLLPVWLCCNSYSGDRLITNKSFFANSLVAA